jgi:hypothetical protein
LAGEKLEGGMEEKLLCGDFQRVVWAERVLLYFFGDTESKNQKDGG